MNMKKSACAIMRHDLESAGYWVIFTADHMIFLLLCLRRHVVFLKFISIET